MNLMSSIPRHTEFGGDRTSGCTTPEWPCSTRVYAQTWGVTPRRVRVWHLEHSMWARRENSFRKVATKARFQEVKKPWVSGRVVLSAYCLMHPPKVCLCMYTYYMDQNIIHCALLSVPDLLPKVLELFPSLFTESILVLLYSCLQCMNML